MSLSNIVLYLVSFRWWRIITSHGNTRGKLLDHICFSVAHHATATLYTLKPPAGVAQLALPSRCVKAYSFYDRAIVGTQVTAFCTTVAPCIPLQFSHPLLLPPPLTSTCKICEWRRNTRKCSRTFSDADTAPLSRKTAQAESQASSLFRLAKSY